MKSLHLALFGFMSLLISFYSPISVKIIETVARPVRLTWDPQKAYKLAIKVGILGTIVHYLSFFVVVPLAYEGFVAFIARLPRLSIAILYTLQLQNKLPKKGKIFLWCVVFPAELFLILSTGATFPVILDFSIFLFIYFYYYKRLPWKRIFLVFLAFFLIFGARDRFREMTWFGGDYASKKPVEKGILYLKLMFENLSGKGEKRYEVYERLSARSDYLVTFAQVVELTPNYVPYWGGYTYSTLLTSLIPRVIMPGKPLKRLGSEFGHRYMLLSPDDFSTSYNLAMLIEMYINFGEVGVIVGMFLLGLIFRIFYSIFNHPQAGEIGLFMSVMVFINLLNLESDFSLIFGSVIQYIILFYLILNKLKLPMQTDTGNIQG